MFEMLHPYSELARYRWISIALLVVALGLPVAVDHFSGPHWLGVILSVLILILLDILTYWRLREAALSGSWIILAIISFNIGPAWHDYHLGSLINFVPVLMAWFAPIGFGAHPQTA
ncbi:MAG: hypothetical protein V4564_20410 [Pseudomonadota bacterium]